jgi:hypothetical protein
MARIFYPILLETLREAAVEKGLTFKYHPLLVIFQDADGQEVGRVTSEDGNIRSEMNRFIFEYQPPVQIEIHPNSDRS